jgi:hypothetical protein
MVGKFKDKYVIRMKTPKARIGDYGDINNIKLVDDKLNGNYGQIIAKTNNDIQILYKQFGEIIYIDKHDNPNITDKNGVIEGIRKVSELPQATFDNYIKNTKYLYDNGYVLDGSKTNNFLFDFKNKKINTVDLNYVGGTQKYDISNLFSPIIISKGINKYHLRGNESIIQPIKIIREKFLNSIQKYIDASIEDSFLENYDWVYAKYEKEIKTEPVPEDDWMDNDSW